MGAEAGQFVLRQVFDPNSGELGWRFSYTGLDCAMARVVGRPVCRAEDFQRYIKDMEFVRDAVFLMGRDQARRLPLDEPHEYRCESDEDVIHRALFLSAVITYARPWSGIKAEDVFQDETSLRGFHDEVIDKYRNGYVAHPSSTPRDPSLGALEEGRVWLVSSPYPAVPFIEVMGHAWFASGMFPNEVERLGQLSYVVFKWLESQQKRLLLRIRDELVSLHGHDGLVELIQQGKTITLDKITRKTPA